MGLMLWPSCSEKEPQWEPRPKPEVADQTLLVYLSGQTLLRHFKTNIQEIQEAIDRHILYDSRLLLYVEPSTRESLLIEYSFDYEKQRSRADTLRRYTSPRLTPDHISTVLNEAYGLAPANRYGLVLGSHGAAWVPSTYPYLTTNEKDNELDIWSQPHPLGLHPERHPLLYKSSKATHPTRWFGEFNGQVTNLSTWIEAFELTQVEIEYMIFDACFMSNIEALYDLRHSTRYIVASPSEIMGRGMPYAKILQELFTDEGRSYDLEAYCKGYYEFYLNIDPSKEQPSGCIALTVCEELEELAHLTREVLQQEFPAVDPSLMQDYEGLNPPLFYDFRQYVESAASSQELLTAFQEQFERTFPEACRWHTPSFYSGYNGRLNPIEYYSGVTCSNLSEKYPTAYTQTAWYRFIRGE